ncbi:hypothetical protein GW17_00046566 [Ensete ventricosum]|nr:hypothetical protein GW17_00046566 [Ensete ventricosum]
MGIPNHTKDFNRRSPFSVIFGTEAVLPPEIVFPTLQVESFKEEASERGLCENLDFIKEHRAEAHLQTLVYRKAMTKIYNQKVRPRIVKDGDLVL